MKKEVKLYIQKFFGSMSDPLAKSNGGIGLPQLSRRIDASSLLVFYACYSAHPNYGELGKSASARRFP